MIAVDTNILVRYAVKDDRRQTALATNFLATHQCHVLKTVLLELVCVLSSPSGYQLDRFCHDGQRTDSEGLSVGAGEPRDFSHVIPNWPIPLSLTPPWDSFILFLFRRK